MGSSAKVHSNEVGELSERVGVEEPSFPSGGGTGFQSLIGVAGLEKKQGPTPPMVAYWHFFSDPDEGEQEGLHTSLYYTQTDTQIDTVRYTQIDTQP